MKINEFLVIMMFALIVASFGFVYSTFTHPDFDHNDSNDKIYIRSNSQNDFDYDIVFNSLSYRDTVMYGMDSDLITLIPIGDNEYKVISENAVYPIGIFTKEDSVNLLSWINAYPLPGDDIKYANVYYQEIVSEKIWE